MSQQVEGIKKTFLANAALTQYRLLKFINGTTVDLAGVADDCMGVAQESVAINAQCCVALRFPGRTFKVTANGAISALAKCFPGASGKVSGTGTGPAQFIALEAATTDGDVIEVVDLGSAAPNGDVSADSASGDNVGGIPMVLRLEGVTATAGTYTIATLKRKVRMIDWWIKSRDGTASNVNIKNAASNASGTIVKGTTVDALVRGADIIAAQADVPAGNAIAVVTSGNASIDVFVLCMPVA